MNEQHMHSVFVYGTLTDPHLRRHVIGVDVDDPEVGVPLFGYVTLNDHGNSQGVCFPRLVPHEDGVIYGTVLRVTDRQLARLDVYEGEGHFYTRETISIGRQPAFVYMAKDNYERTNRETVGGCTEVGQVRAREAPLA